MKKITVIALSLILCAGLTACGTPAQSANSETPVSVSEIPTNPESNPSETIASGLNNTAEPSTDGISYEVTYANAKTYKNSIGTVWVQAIFEVENTGSKPLYMNTGAFDLEDADGKLIKSRDMVSSYPEVIDPGEKAYYYEETTIEELSDALDLNIIPRPKAQAAKVDNIRLQISDFEISDGQLGLKMRGRIENNTSDTQKMVYIAAILFNDSDCPVGRIFTILTDDLGAGDKIGFEGTAMSLPKEITADNVARYEVFAYPMQFQF